MITLTSFDQIRDIAANGYDEIRWPDEASDAEPLLMDSGTASLLVQTHDMLNPDNAAKMVRLLLAHRWHCVQFAEFAWSKASFRGAV